MFLLTRRAVFNQKLFNCFADVGSVESDFSPLVLLISFLIKLLGNEDSKSCRICILTRA